MLFKIVWEIHLTIRTAHLYWKVIKENEKWAEVLSYAL